jgi:hypothetical protein
MIQHCVYCNDSASPEELQNGLRIGAPVRNGLLARAAWQVQATPRLLRLPHAFQELRFHFHPACGYYTLRLQPTIPSTTYNCMEAAVIVRKTTGYDWPKGRFQCCNRTIYKDTSILRYFPRDREPNQNQRANQTNTNLCKSLTRAHPTSHAFSRNGSAHERLLRRVVVQ